MRSPLLTLAALSACALSSGCVTAVAGAAAGVGLYAVQDRTIGEGIDDATASQEVKARLMAADARGFAEVDVEVADGNLLLSGVAPTEQHRQAAEMIARNVRSVHSVYNEVFVGAPSTFARSAQDEFITAQIRARLMASSSVRSVNVNIETYNGNVYLMGLARTDREVQRAAEIASTAPGVQRVVSFMQVRPLAPAPYATASIDRPAPIYNAPQAAQQVYEQPAYQAPAPMQQTQLQQTQVPATSYQTPNYGPAEAAAPSAQNAQEPAPSPAAPAGAPLYPY